MRRSVALTAAAVTVLFAGTASATRIIPLATPPAPSYIANVHWGYSAASGFSPDGNRIVGVCQYSFGSAPRYHPSSTVSFNCSWALDGSLDPLGSQCNATDTNGHGWAGGCARSYQGNGTVVMVNGVPFYYVSTNYLGAQVVSSNVQSFVVLPDSLSLVGVGDPRPAFDSARLSVTPNPFRGRTVLGFSIADDRVVEIGVYDVAGRLVRTLQHGLMSAGPHQIAWDGLSSRGEHEHAGIYFVHVRSGRLLLTTRVIQLR